MTDPGINRGDQLTLTLESWGRLGEAMAQYQGWDVFVFGGIPGERAESLSQALTGILQLRSCAPGDSSTLGFKELASPCPGRPLCRP